jgi:hypothetical protein
LLAHRYLRLRLDGLRARWALEEKWTLLEVATFVLLMSRTRLVMTGPLATSRRDTRRRE